MSESVATPSSAGEEAASERASREVPTGGAASEQLKHSDARFRSLVHNLSDAILITEPDGTITGDTPSFERMFGYPGGAVIGRNAMEFVHPDDIGAASKAFAETVSRTNPGIPTEFRGLAHDGTYVTLEALADNLIDDPGIRGIVITLRDVTERKRVEEQRRVIEARLQHTQKLESLAVLAGGVAHDFNNLLTGVLGHVSLALREMPSDAPTRRRLEQVRLAAQRASELTRQLLAYSGKGHFVVRPVQLSEIVEEMTRLLEVSISKECELHCLVGRDVPMFDADPSQMRQVVMNLILNASEAIGDRPGTITVRSGSVWCDQGCLPATDFDDVLAEGEYVYLDVEDNGCGMDADVRAKIFDPFFTTKLTGRGLGLAAVLGIVRGHRGAIQVQTEPGKGTRFRVLFPAMRRDSGEVAAGMRDAGELAAAVDATVLVIDDDDTVRELAASVLREAGFRVLLASGVKKGVEVFTRERDNVRAVVLGLMTPHAGQGDALQSLLSVRSDARVILTSGYAEPEIARELGPRHLAAFLRKPFSPAELVRAVQRAIAR
jgi:two-component system, cell cycle sensor histidine kinase and response regulator CckA